MAVDVNGIREALAAKLAAGISREFSVYDGYIPPVPVAPCILVKPASEFATVERSFERPYVTLRFELWMLLDPGMGTDGQRILGEFMSMGAGQPNSAYDALENGTTLGGLIDALTIDSIEYRNQLLLGQPESQVPFDWAVVNVTVTAHG